MEKYTTVEEYSLDVDSKKKPMWNQLRNILLDMGFDEQIKWYLPVYSVHGRNAVGLGSVKDKISLWLFEGNRINDHLGVLINAQEGKTEEMRHWRFESLAEINDDNIRDYLTQAIEIAANPIKKVKTKKAISIPPLLAAALKNDKTLNTAFSELANYKQRDYCEHIATAKRAATQHSRLEKIIPMILQGIGLSDKYRK